MKKPGFPIAREGYPFILFSAFATLTCGLLEWDIAALVGLLTTAFVTAFFRDPARVTPEDKTAIICPADGKVLFVEETFDDRFLKQEVIKISIFMNVFNVHVNRVPFAGTIQNILFKPGKFYSADKDKATLHNEYCAVTVTTPSGQKYGVVQIAGLIARRIVCWAEKGDQVEAGQRYGLIRFGSRVDLYLPKDATVSVKKGEKVKAGETILGNLTV
jgi:phosphatidylserine decarboxylase